MTAIISAPFPSGFPSFPAVDLPRLLGGGGCPSGCLFVRPRAPSRLVAGCSSPCRQARDRDHAIAYADGRTCGFTTCATLWFCWATTIIELKKKIVAVFPTVSPVFATPIFFLSHAPFLFLHLSLSLIQGSPPYPLPVDPAQPSPLYPTRVAHCQALRRKLGGPTIPAVKVPYWGRRQAVLTRSPPPTSTGPSPRRLFRLRLVCPT
jgi:hypothetical protein